MTRKNRDSQFKHYTNDEIVTFPIIGEELELFNYWDENQNPEFIGDIKIIEYPEKSLTRTTSVYVNFI